MRMLAKTTLTCERIFAQLRSDNMMQPGQVCRLYIEANGSFTLIPNREERPGLLSMPDVDTDLTSLYEPG